MLRASYAHVHGHGDFYGTVNRHTNALVVQTTGRLSFLEQPTATRQLVCRQGLSLPSCPVQAIECPVAACAAVSVPRSRLGRFHSVSIEATKTAGE
jgi:hypothetical protein